MNQALEVYERFKDLFISSCGSCLKSGSGSITLNGRRFNIIKLLGEGGFSYVYLTQDETSGRQFALKKIRCPLGSESVSEAMKEVEAYKRFRHPNCIRCLDSAVTQEADGKVIYLFLPFYKKGNLQDAIAAHAVNGTSYPEREMLSLFLGTCQAVRAMHTYTSAGPSGTYPPSGPGTASTSHLPRTIDGAVNASGTSKKNKGKGRAVPAERIEQQEDDEEEAIRSAAGAAEPLIGSMDRAQEADDDEHHGIDESGAANVPGLGESTGRLIGRLPSSPAPLSGVGGTSNPGELQPWAHRDIKPANVMLSDEGAPILMDFGSALPARIPIKNRSIALACADDASEHCSMPFRAPELFDPPVGSILDEKVDVWSLGCTLYAMAYGHSPFEVEGSSVVLAVRNGQYRFPSRDRGYTEEFRELIRFMLEVKPESRPDIHQVSILLCVNQCAGLTVFACAGHREDGSGTSKVIESRRWPSLRHAIKTAKHIVLSLVGIQIPCDHAASPETERNREASLHGRVKAKSKLRIRQGDRSHHQPRGLDGADQTCRR